MGFALETSGHGAPQWPHIVCAGDANLSGRGWAWHDAENRRRCYAMTGGLAASAIVVAAAIDGHTLPGVDKILAIATLSEEIPGLMKRVFRRECAACKRDHYQRAQWALMAVKYIHPDAVSALRRANVPERLMREPLIREVGARLPEDPEEIKRLLANEDTDHELAKKVKRAIRRAHNLPVWLNDPERTRLAQIAYARQYALSVRSR